MKLSPYLSALFVSILILVVIFYTIWSYFIASPTSVIYSLWNSIEDKSKALFLLELAKFIATFGGAVVVLWNVKISQDNRNLTEEKIDAETFAKGIDQLSSEKSSTTRLGGVSTLEQVALNSKRYYPIVIDILASLLKEISQDNKRLYSNRLIKSPVYGDSREYKELSHEFLSALAALNRLYRRQKLKYKSAVKISWIKRRKRDVDLIDMRNMSIDSAFLEGADFSNFDLSGANFSQSFLTSANFTNAYIRKAKFIGSSLGGVNFEGAVLEQSNFSDADLSSANLKSANFTEAILERANLSDAQVNDFTEFNDADVMGATLKGCRLSQQQEAQLVHFNLAHR